MTRPGRLLAMIAVAALAAGGAFAAASSSPQPGMRFNANAAMALIREQLAYGQRPAGSPQLRALADKLRPLLPGGHFEPLPDWPGLRDIVGQLPGGEPAVLIGAHYDTLASPKGFLGANNGAAGTAIVIELARELAQMHRPAGAPAVVFALFDGEEPASGLPEQYSNFYDTGLRGSRAYVGAHPDDERAMILLDYVAGKGLQLPREESSTPSLWARVTGAGAQVGASSIFPNTVGPDIIDDQTPFLNQGIPAVDMIDWRYPGHTLRDTYAALSEHSVLLVGRTLLQLLTTRWR
ncbi:MAG TPA: M28 family metallopeptidase [Solirubrobacteraceae bacterium]|jgi:hypothetical protein|nr:M28 family metallopeptidase [Solirubrobacteraceae bacterium]